MELTMPSSTGEFVMLHTVAAWQDHAVNPKQQRQRFVAAFRTAFPKTLQTQTHTFRLHAIWDRREQCFSQRQTMLQTTADSPF